MEIIKDENEIKLFEQQKQEEERKYIEQAIKDKEEKLKNEETQQVGPVTIGYEIQDEPIEIQNILEEEKRITIQGYVFEVDIRNLRSGRDILIVSVTDYTDSLQMKMFSRNEEQKRTLQKY